MPTRFLIPILLLVPFINVAQATHELPNPVAWWKLDEAPGATTFTDSAGTNDGSCTATTCPTMGAVGQFDTAGDFDGVDDDVEVPDSASLDLTTFTVSVWFNQDTTTASIKSLVRKGSQNYFIRLDSTGQVPGCTTRVGGVSVGSGSTIPIVNGVWNHAVCVYDGTRLSFYLNGAPDGSTTALGTAEPNANLLGIGGTPNGQFFDGRIDNVRIFNQALTTSQIEDLFLEPGHHACSDQDAVNAQTGFLSNLMPLLILMFLLTVVAVRIPIPRLK